MPSSNSSDLHSGSYLFTVTMVALRWCFCVLITGSTLSFCSLGASLLGCGANEQILSRNTELLPNSGISVSSRLIDAYAAADVVNFGVVEFNVWCASRDDNDPYVLLRFGSTVVITGLVSGGYTSTVGNSEMRYVTNFTIEYSLSSYGDDFTFYSTNVAGSPKYLHVPTINTLFALEQPFMARRVRLSPKAWHDSSYACWSFLIYGCRSPESTDHEVCPQLPSPTSHLPAHPSPPSSLPEPSTCPPLPTSSSSTSTVQVELVPRTQVVEKDYQVVSIVLPIVLVTTLIVVAIVGVGIAVHLRGRGVSLNLNIRNPHSFWSAQCYTALIRLKLVSVVALGTANISMEKCHAYDTMTQSGSFKCQNTCTANISMEKCYAYNAVTQSGSSNCKQKETRPRHKEEDIYEN